MNGQKRGESIICICLVLKIIYVYNRVRKEKKNTFFPNLMLKRIYLLFDIIDERNRKSFGYRLQESRYFFCIINNKEKKIISFIDCRRQDIFFPYNY